MAERKALPFPTASQLQSISKCPAFFWGEKGPDVKLPPRDNKAADLGTRIHKCLEVGFERGPFPEAIGFFRKSLVLKQAELLDCVDEAMQAFKAVSMVFLAKGYAKSVKDSEDLEFGTRDIFTEIKMGLLRNGRIMFGVGSGDPYLNENGRLAGTADLILDLGEGIAIIDWKTGQHDSVDRGEHPLQLEALGFMAMSALNRKYVEVAFVYTNRVGDGELMSEFWKYTRDEIEDAFFERIFPMLHGAKNKTREYVNPGTCRYCPRSHVCKSFNMHSAAYFSFREDPNKDNEL